MTYDERRVYSDGAGCQHGTEVYRHEPYRHYCMDCGADLDEIMDLVGLQADLEELEKTDAIVKAAATSYANMVARVTGAQPDAELSEHERLTRALDAARAEIADLTRQRDDARDLSIRCGAFQNSAGTDFEAHLEAFQ